jgi:hypothetical protein
MFNIGSFFDKAIAEAKLIAAAIEMGINQAHVVEAALPIPQAGKQKMDMVLNHVETALTTATGIVGQIDVPKILAAVQTTVSAFVAVSNGLGVFKKSVPA